MAYTWKLSDGTTVTAGEAGVRVSGDSEVADAIRTDVKRRTLCYDPIGGVHPFDPTNPIDVSDVVRGAALRAGVDVTEAPELPEPEWAEDEGDDAGDGEIVY